MAKQRKDNKGRALRPGEYQRADGRYEYKYVENGKTHSIYSFRLTETDRTPAGKKPEPSLRELEHEIKTSRAKSVSYYDAHNTTLNDIVDRYLKSKVRLRESTYNNYVYMYNYFVRSGFGQKKLSDLRYSDVLIFYSELVNKKMLAINTLDTIQNVIHPSLTMAVRDGVIGSNPSDNVIGELKKTLGWTPPKKHSLTIAEQNAFISYLVQNKDSEEKTAYRLACLLLGTGMRVGELTAMRRCDIDLETKMIHVMIGLSYRRDSEGKCGYHIHSAKTEAGIRDIPMFDNVRQVLTDIITEQDEQGCRDIIIDGESGFILRNRFGDVMSEKSVNGILERARLRYNKFEETAAKASGRKPVILEHFSAHNLRHTFCTRLCENLDKLGIIMSVMGHRDAQTTLAVYNEVHKEVAKDAFSELEGKIRLG